MLVTLVVLLFLKVSSVAAGSDCREFPIQPISELPQPYSPVDTTYYGKFVMSNGFPIMAPSSVNDRFLVDAARSLKGFTAALQPILLQKLQQNHKRLMIYGTQENICAVPEVNKGKPCSSGGYGVTFGPFTVFKEDWSIGKECGMGVMFHEFAHQINSVFDTELQKQLNDAYKAANASGLYKGRYGMSSAAEYFGEVRSWFADGYDCVLGPTMCTKDDFIKRDPKYVALIKRVFPGWQWTNKCEYVCDADSIVWSGAKTEQTDVLQEFRIEKNLILAVMMPNTRLSNHYKQIIRNSSVSCWNECLKDWSSGCRASTYVKPEKQANLVNNCYLFKDNDYQKGSAEGWTSFISADSQQKDVKGNIQENKRLSNHYSLFPTTSARMCFEFCKKEAQNGCVASTFVDKQIAKWTMDMNCFLYKQGYTISDGLGWTSYTTN